MSLDKAKNFLRRAIPPINKQSILNHYVPLGGAFSHSLFTINLFTPPIIERAFPNSYEAVADLLLASSNAALGVYIYNSNHMKKISKVHRCAYSVFGSLMFNLGSLTLTVILRGFMRMSKDSLCLRSMVASAISYALLFLGYKYANAIDKISEGARDAQD